MPAPETAKNEGLLISALRARSTFGQLLRRVEKDSRGLIYREARHPQGDSPEHQRLCASGLT